MTTLDWSLLCLECSGPIAPDLDIEFHREEGSEWICNACWSAMDDEEQESWIDYFNDEGHEVVLPW